jgi:hypothetical protein
MNQRIGIDLPALVIGALLVVQASFAAYGVGFVRDLASTTHAQLAAVADASR